MVTLEVSFSNEVNIPLRDRNTLICFATLRAKGFEFIVEILKTPRGRLFFRPDNRYGSTLLTRWTKGTEAQVIKTFKERHA
jgi:hypothetical protein